MRAHLIPLAEEAGVSMPHLAMAFAISHPGVTSALLGFANIRLGSDVSRHVPAAAQDSCPRAI
jgi:aryl-alcohol dehydrogenase-like predicted oxidoreductase